MILSLIFITWRTEMLRVSHFDCQAQVVILDIFTATLQVKPFSPQNYGPGGGGHILYNIMGVRLCSSLKGYPFSQSCPH